MYDGLPRPSEAKSMATCLRALVNLVLPLSEHPLDDRNDANYSLLSSSSALLSYIACHRGASMQSLSSCAPPAFRSWSAVGQ